MVLNRHGGFRTRTLPSLARYQLTKYVCTYDGMYVTKKNREGAKERREQKKKRNGNVASERGGFFASTAEYTPGWGPEGILHPRVRGGCMWMFICLFPPVRRDHGCASVYSILLCRHALAGTVHATITELQRLMFLLPAAYLLYSLDREPGDLVV